MTSFQVMKLALEPCLANALLRSAEHRCTEEMLIIVALISVDYAKIFYIPRERVSYCVHNYWPQFSYPSIS